MSIVYVVTLSQSYCPQWYIKLGSVCRNCSIIFFRFRGRYLSRRIAYPSNGSFNPFIISNKEAHIVNGNINSEATKVLEEKHNAICDSTDSICTYMYEGSNVRDHFCNYCLTNVGKFSCAVDCFLELCYFVFRFSKNLRHRVRGKHQPRYLDPGFHRATRSPAGWI